MQTAATASQYAFSLLRIDSGRRGSTRSRCQPVGRCVLGDAHLLIVHGYFDGASELTRSRIEIFWEDL